MPARRAAGDGYRGGLPGRHPRDGRGFAGRSVRDGVRSSHSAVLRAVRARAPMGPAQRARPARVDVRPPGPLGGAVVVQLGDLELSGAELRNALGGFELEGVAARSSAPRGPSTTCPSPRSTRRRSPSSSTTSRAPSSTAGRRRSTGGPGFAPWPGLGGRRVPALGGAVLIAEVADGTSRLAQQSVDEALGLFDEEIGAQP